MDRFLQRSVDVLTIIVGLAALIVIGARFVTPPASSVEIADNVRLDAEATGIDFSVESKTLLMVLRSDCGFCQESMPFYRRLLERDTSNVQVIVAAPPYDAGIGDYLASEEVNPDSVVFVNAGVLPVSGTPTLLVVDAEGLVTHAWVGLLNADREEEVFNALFG